MNLATFLTVKTILRDPLLVVLGAAASIALGYAAYALVLLHEFVKKIIK